MERNEDKELRLGWSRRLTLRQRILAVNIFAIAILAGSLFYLDSFRTRLTEDRVEQYRSEAVMFATILPAVPAENRQDLLAELGRISGARLRVYDREGRKRGDSWSGSTPTYDIRDPQGEAWYRKIARGLDNGFDALVGEDRPDPLQIPESERLQDWPEAMAVLRSGGAMAETRITPEGTLHISAAAGIGEEPQAVLLLTDNPRDIRRVVRAERFTLALVIAATLLLSILLSRFLARTIASPLRALALAAHRVRLGRAREVDVPVLPARRDEIGLLARALGDMTQSLRDRIDATEAFAADVTHELKNPLASLRSAVDSLERVEDPKLQRRLLDVVRNDVARLDRLIVDIAEASRLDAELSRARFEPIDLGQLIETLLPIWEQRGDGKIQIAFARPRTGTAVIAGVESRLARLLDNLVDNAISFSPSGGLIDIRASATDGEVVISVEDEGPGVAGEARGAIFNRFHSMRSEEDFGRHSGLGLAIARAIVEGHGGSIEVEDRRDGRQGARFVVRFPGAGA